MTRRRKFYPSTTDRILLNGGKNNKFSPNVIADNESPDALNVIFNDNAAGTREGSTKLTESSLGSFVGDGLFTRRSNTGAETMIVFNGGLAYTWSGSTFATLPSAQSVWTGGVRVCSDQFQNHIFFGNGTQPYKYNGTDWTRHGVEQPNSAPTVATAGTGNALSGTFSWKVNYVNTALVEGNLGSAITDTLASENAALTSIPVAPQSYGVDARKIYRTTDGGTEYKLVATISDNTTTTYDDAISDASLGASAPTDNGVPPNYTCVLYHQNRLFFIDAANPNFVTYSDLNEPYTVGALSFVRVGDGSTDLTKGLYVYQDQILVACEKSMWMIYMPSSDATTWKPLKLDSSFGSKSPFMGIPVNGKLMFAATQADQFMGFAAISGTSTDPQVSLLTVTAVGSNLKSAPIEPDMLLVPEAQAPDVTGIVFQNRAIIAISYGASQTTNNRIYYADFSLSNIQRKQELAWVPWTGLNAADFTVFDGKLYFVDSTATGFVRRLLDGTYNDDGAAIDSYLVTKEYSGHKVDTSFHKDFRFTNILVDKAGAYNMGLNYKSNSDAGSGTTEQVDLDPGGSLWGVMIWGTDNWGGGTDREDIRVFLGTTAGQRIQLTFNNQNTADQRFKVHGLNFVYNLKGYR